MKNRNGHLLEPAKIRELFSDISGISRVETRDGEGAGTWGFTLRAHGLSDPREAVFGTAVANDLILLDMHRERVSLEETFRRLTSGQQGETNV